MSITWRELHEGYDRSQEEALALAQRALADLQAGTTTFTELRARYTRGGPGREDGWIGMFSRRPGTTGVFDALSAVPEGGLFGPYKDEGGFSVMRRGRFFRSVVRQILVKFREATPMEPGVTRMKAEAQMRAQEALAAARAHPERWAELVLKYSDDLDTRADEGSLGCISIGAMTEKRLEDAILDTPPGTIHPNLLESPLGFHIFYRVD